jgi:hypothetical protein
MRFKAGDMAYIKRPWNIGEDIGRPVTILRMGVWGEKVVMRVGGISHCNLPSGAQQTAWLVDAHGSAFPCFIVDVCLGKLGGEDIHDETLTLAGKPQELEATE